MKKHYALYSLLLIPALALLIAFTSGPPAGHTGSPLDGQNCTACHQGSDPVTVSGWIETNIPADGYTPGDVYLIELYCQSIVAEKYGFQITAETATAKAGTWVDISPRTQLVGDDAMTHTTEGTVPDGTPNFWTMDWVAPAAGTGTVTLYAAVNKTNNDNTYDGDEIYLTSLEVPEANTGISENQLHASLEVYPNPATSNLNITLPLNSEVRIFDNNGRELMHRISTTETESFDVSTLVQGMYFVHVMHDGRTASRSIIKK
jgi:hypothetical protein